LAEEILKIANKKEVKTLVIDRRGKYVTLKDMTGASHKSLFIIAKAQ